VLADPVVIDDISIRIRVTIGFALSPEDGQEVAKLRSRAQTSMMEAKKRGISQAFRSLPHHATAEANELRILVAIEEMMLEGTFEVYYQPVCRPNGEICGLEALLRMNHPKLGSISPAVFIPIAEESGLIIGLGQWVLERVCMQICEWRNKGIQMVPVAINISGLQVRQSDFANRIVGTLNAFDIPSHLIHMELTETTVLRNISDVLEEMKKLSAIGLRFSIDDFGTGYSSLGRLQEMPISTLKIDRSFVQGITRSTSLMVAAIISLAHALDMKVIAEGIETAEELEVLCALNCDLIQGYIFSQPLRASTLESLLTAGRCTAAAETPSSAQGLCA